MPRRDPRAPLAIVLGVFLIGGGCAHSTQPSSAGAGVGAPAPRAANGARARGATSRPSEATDAQRKTIERSALRERAISLLQDAAFDPWALARANAIEGLQHAPARVEPVVRAGLVDENLGVRYVAAVTVGDLHLKNSVAQVRPLLNDPDVSVRIGAIYAILANGGDVDRDPMAQALLSGPVRARNQAAFLLGEIGDPSAVPLLRDAARRLSGGEGEAISTVQRRILRLQISESLVRLGEVDMLHTLRAALYPASPDEFEATALAIQMLGRLKDQDSAAQLIQLIEYATPATAKDPDPMRRVYIYPPEVRLAAATSLARMGYRDGAYVGAQYEEASDEAIRAQVTFLYGAIGRPEELARLDLMLDDPSILVRIAAAASILDALSG